LFQLKSAHRERPPRFFGLTRLGFRLASTLGGKKQPEWLKNEPKNSLIFF
jgi:hypothetical protein